MRALQVVWAETRELGPRHAGVRRPARELEPQPRRDVLETARLQRFQQALGLTDGRGVQARADHEPLGLQGLALALVADLFGQALGGGQVLHGAFQVAAEPFDLAALLRRPQGQPQVAQFRTERLDLERRVPCRPKLPLPGVDDRQVDEHLCLAPRRRRAVRQPDALAEMLDGLPVIAQPLGGGAEVVERGAHVHAVGVAPGKREGGGEMLVSLVQPTPHGVDAPQVVVRPVALLAVPCQVGGKRLRGPVEVTGVEVRRADGVARPGGQRRIAHPQGDLERLQGSLERLPHLAAREHEAGAPHAALGQRLIALSLPRELLHLCKERFLERVVGAARRDALQREARLEPEARLVLS